MGLLEPITHKEEIEDLMSSAQRMYDNSKENFEEQKDKTSKALEELGKLKLKSWANEMEMFSSKFKCFNNVEIIKKEEKSLEFIGKNEKPEQMLINIEEASMNAQDMLKAGGLALGAGALVGIASYGGAALFAKASTGKAISTLKGAAKTNSILAFFGGGAKATGGLGVLGGKVVLAGIVVAPVLLVSGLIAGANGKAKLEEAKKIHAEAKEKSEKIDMMTTGMLGIEKMSNNYRAFIKKFNKKFSLFLNELERIKEKYNASEENMVDFNTMTIAEQKTLHISWLMAQVYYHILSVSILTDDGKVSKEAEESLKYADKTIKDIKKDTLKLTGEEAGAADLLWKDSANLMLIINMIFCILMIKRGIDNISYEILEGLAYIISSIIAFPIFFKYKNLPKNKLFKWRVIRLIIAIFFIIIVL